MQYLHAFLCGGVLCAIGQLLIDKTQLTPARILTGYVVAGVLLQAIGIYQAVVDWGGAGATVPLTGFGYSLAKGVAKAVAEEGALGVLTGGSLSDVLFETASALGTVGLTRGISAQAGAAGELLQQRTVPLAPSALRRVHRHDAAADFAGDQDDVRREVVRRWHGVPR